MTPHRSYWLEEALSNNQEKSLPELSSSIESDVTILGGGYVGLWTAIRIKQKSPSTNVVVLEQDICGGGASGRNGGFVLSWWPKISSLIKLCGKDKAVQIALDSQQAISEIGTFCRANQIDCHFKQSGWIWTATSKSQMNAWEGVVNRCEELGVDIWQRLTPHEVAKRTGSSAHLAGVVDKTAATLHPARLVRGLRRVALGLGITIFEQTKAIEFSRRAPLVVTTEKGKVATKKLVIATNAWAASIKELSRSIVAITSDMVMTAPAARQLAEIGWVGGESIADSQLMVDYYQVTKGHRIAFGKGGWGIAYGGQIGQDFNRNKERALVVEDDFRRYYPNLKNLKITHDWCGPIDRTPNSLPLLGFLGENKDIIYGVGWSGNGVGPSLIGGQVLSSLALELQDRWANYPLIGKSVGKFPPEPIRYIGAHIVRKAVTAKERAEMDNKRPPYWATQLAKLAPAGLEDKE